MKKTTANRRPMRHALCVLLTVLLTVWVAPACRDELLGSVDDADPRPAEGLPATIYLRVAIDDMLDAEATRTFIDEAAANYCTDIWIGIYRESDGKRIYSKLLTEPAQINELVDTKYGVGRFEVPVESGRVYIVGVANSTIRNGLASYKKDPASDQRSLSELLEEATTWQQFRDIIIVRPDPTAVTMFAPDLLMSGYYSEDPDNYKEVDEDSIPTYDINPGTHSMEGAIYLRRLISYNKFNIKSGANVTFEPTSWRVCNNPGAAHLFEGTDAMSIELDSLDWYGTTDELHTFATENDSVKSFEAYTLSNKEDAVAYERIGDDYVGIRPNVSLTEMYADRERQFKDASGRNTGVFRSLVRDPNDNPRSVAMHGNTATYVEIQGRITYYVANTDANRANPERGEPEPYDPSKSQILREGKMKYTVHLGYNKHKDDDGTPTYKTACDFRIRRNTKYTYNITVKGINKVILEALSGEERQAGAEGTVTDAYDNIILLDAHYGVFNISLSNRDRYNMGYVVKSPFGSQTLEYADSIYDPAWEKLEFYSWLKFKPTSDANTLAVYNDGTATNDLWSLHDLANPAAKKHPKASADLHDDTQLWYTVFVDEYVYHQDINGNVTSESEHDWQNYVNSANRTCHLVVSNHARAGDGNSVYTSSRYVVSQRSIQTYYKEVDGSSTGVGVEHVNESFGLNMQSYPQTHLASYSKLNPKNGRMNEMRFGWVYGGQTWSKMVNFTKPTHIDADANSSTYFAHDAADYAVPALVPYTSAGSSPNGPSPSDKNIYYADLACMNRNRDLDGDGKISAKELKWYLPTYWGYVRIAAGQAEMLSPLMSWDKYAPTIFAAMSGLNGRQRYHYYCSDNRYLWAEEGMSVGESPFSEQTAYPYEVRCIRNLGTEMPDYDHTWPATVGNDVASPYTVRGDTITMTYYAAASIRATTQSYLPQHAINDYANRPSAAFVVASDYCKSLQGSYAQLYVDDDGYVCPQQTATSKTEQDWVNLWSASVVRNTICREYAQRDDRKDLTKWRVPNQLELTFMQMAGFIDDADNVVCATHEYFYTYPTETNKYKYFGISKGIMTRSIFENYLSKKAKFKVRCVKDVY